MPVKIPFRVSHVSGQDENYKAVELNTHSPTTKGWQASRFCLYPQDIVLQLDKRSRLRKVQILSHQYLVATKIEFYVGDVPEGTTPSLQNARYTRLGYVALSDNEKTGFKARELKSVHVDALGQFVKFVIHKNHVNKHNLYNQVGIVAINIIGDDITSNKANYPYVADEKTPSDPVAAGLFNRPDYISPLDDLAFDMYQDPEVANIIRKLEAKKQEAVLQERYDYAKKVKSAIQDLQKVGEKLGKYEVEKRQAVENEDYDKAKLKKLQMDEYRLQVYKQLELHDLMELSGSRHHQPLEFEPERARTPPRLSELNDTPVPPLNYSPRGNIPNDERPLPAIKNRDQQQDDGEKPEDNSAAIQRPESRPIGRPDSQPIGRPESRPIGGDHSKNRGDTYRSQETPLDDAAEDRPLPNNRNQYPEDDEIIEDQQGGNVTGEPEPMSEKDQREADIVINTFGLPLASKAYSKTWSFREDALLEVYKQLTDLQPHSGDAKAMLRAAVFLCNKGIKDKVVAVFTASLNLLKMILTEFISKNNLGKSDTSHAIHGTLPGLLVKTGDTAMRNRDEAVRNRDAAKQFIIEESKFQEVQPLHMVPVECAKPFKVTVAPRMALSRTEILADLYKQHTLNNSGLTVENMMRFCTVAIQHNAGEVREKAEKIIVALYRDVGAPVKDHLPPDDEKTRKNVLYKQLFEAFDRIDGKPSKDDLKKQKKNDEAAKQKEIDALQQQLAQLKDMTAGKAPPDEKLLKDKKEKDKKNAGKKQRPPPPAPAEKEKDEDVATLFQIDHTCIFCGEKNESFTEEGLDLHYWKSCPMLKRCSYCKQVVEVAGLTDHLLTECDSKDNFQKCPRCSEAILKTDFPQHQADKADNPSEMGKSHCPLCHQNIAAGEDGWKTHLMGKDGCKQNPRRMAALNRQAKGGGGAAKKPAIARPVKK